MHAISAFSDLNIITVAIFSEIDSISAHVSLADKAFLLQGSATTAYLDM